MTGAPTYIFLDMDGVMIGDRMSGGSPLYTAIRKSIEEISTHPASPSEFEWTIAKGRNLNKGALTNLHTLIDRVEEAGRKALIVLSTAWRNDATVKQHREDAFAQHRFGELICGKTAPERGEQSWTPEYKAGTDFSKEAEAKGFELESRGATIRYWLHEHAGENPDFIVIDDAHVDDLKQFGARFIETYNILEAKHVDLACAVLKV